MKGSKFFRLRRATDATQRLASLEVADLRAGFREAKLAVFELRNVVLKLDDLVVFLRNALLELILAAFGLCHEVLALEDNCAHLSGIIHIQAQW